MFKSKLISVLGLAAALGALGAFAEPPADAHKPATGHAAPEKATKVGDKAPDFALKDLDGKQVSLKDYAGKIVVLEWVNSGCPVCRGAHEDGRIPGMIKELKAIDGVQYLAINSTASATADEYKQALKKYGIEYTVLMDNDGKVGHAYGAKTTPHLFVIDTKGVLRYQGALDDDKTGAKTKSGEKVTNYALNAVKQIKSGETVSPDSTQSYGCNVKYGKGAS